MTDPLADALYNLKWGSEREESTPLSAEQCRALREHIEDLESRVPKPVDGEVATA